MPKRKAVKEVKQGEVDLPSLPDNVLNGDTSAGEPARKTRKRKVEDEVQVDVDVTPKKRNKRVTEGKDEQVSDDDVKQKRTKKRKVEVKDEEQTDVYGKGEVVEKKVKKKRKTKEEKEAEAMPLAVRTVGHKLYIGAHVSSSGGVHNSVLNSVHIGANAFALFLKSQRKWRNPTLADDVCTSFHANCKSHVYDQTSHVVPHGSYLVNLAHTDPARTEQAYEGFLDDLKRCERLGIKLYNFHPGVANSTGGDRQAAIAHLAVNLNRAHRETSSVVTLLENMAHGGNTLGSTFEDLRDTIALVHNKDRVGVCLDTCHTFAGGYDLRTPEAFRATMDQFENIVGFKYLRALHINDSKAPYASHRDLHANIGTGFLGLRAFHNIVNEPRFQGLPLILETPIDAKDDNGVPIKNEKGKETEDRGNWAREIKLLESLVGMDTKSRDFLKLESDLAKKGESERKKMLEQADKKREKEEKKAAKAKKPGKKGQKKAKKESDDDESSLSDLEDEG